MNVTKIGPDLRSPWLSRARDLSRDLALVLVNHKYVFQKFFNLIDKFSNRTNTTVCPSLLDARDFSQDWNFSSAKRP